MRCIDSTITNPLVASQGDFFVYGGTQYFSGKDDQSAFYVGTDSLKPNYVSILPPRGSNSNTVTASTMNGFDCYIKIPTDIPITIRADHLKWVITRSSSYELTLPPTSNTN